MKVSKIWLNDFVEIDNLYELADRFSLHSQEVESVYELTDVNNLAIGLVTNKEKHPKADKLNVCQVDVGTEKLQIVCGAPNVEEGQKVIVAKVGAKLPQIEIAPVELRGVESNGMICSLTELGIDKKYADASGIEVLSEDAPIGENPLEYLMLNTTVLELDLTPNRSDLLSMMGVAYDAAAFYDLPVSIPYTLIDEIDEENPMEVTLETDKCMAYYTRVIKNVEIKESPQWLRARLIAAGMRPINNVVDITNYIMLETGQPLHAFDMEKFASHSVVVRMAEKDETFVTLDDKKRSMHEDDIMITNGSISTGIGGVMGGFNTEIDENTKYVLLESAAFHPTYIRKTSRRLDLRSDASSRFEKGIDPNRTLIALERATELFQQLAEGEVLKGIKCVENRDLEPKTISITTDFIQRTLGATISEDEIIGIFDRLQFESSVNSGVCEVEVPTRRIDIETKQDLIEEVARIYGYVNIPNTLPKTVSKGSLTPRQQQLRHLRRELNGLGLDETVTYSLVNEKDVYTYVLQENETTKLMMPMSEDKAVLRLSLLNGLLPVVSYNVARKVESMALFEIGASYTKEQHQHLAAVFTGKHLVNTWSHQELPYDFFYVKGVLDAALDQFGVKATYEAANLGDVYHPGQSANVLVDGNVIGLIAKLHPKHEKELDVSDTFVFEVNLDALPDTLETVHFTELQKYPTVERDIAMVLKQSIPVQALLDVITDCASTRLQDVVIFDRYIGSNVEADEQSIALKLFFNDVEKTLESAEVQEEVDQIVNELVQKFDAKLRD